MCIEDKVTGRVLTPFPALILGFLVVVLVQLLLYQKRNGE
jgi:hypothetical protein